MTNQAIATSPAIRFDDVGVYYGDNQVIEDVSMEVTEKEITAIIGPQRRRKKHSAALHKPDERPHPVVPHGRPSLVRRV